MRRDVRGCEGLRQRLLRAAEIISWTILKETEGDGEKREASKQLVDVSED